MTDDTLAASSAAQQGRVFAPLASSLAQLVEDRFDDDQSDQAVELLEQLLAEGIRPPQSLLQKLVALSLCSLLPAQVASSSRWTLNHELSSIASRFVTEPKTKGAAAPTATDRPSPASVLRATSLLIQYSQANPATKSQSGDGQTAVDGRHKSALLARHILRSLPSQRRPLKNHESTSPKQSRSASVLSESGHESSIELSPIEKWVRNDLQRAEDIWDLLCNRRFSTADPERKDSLTQVREFWMKASEHRRYQKQLAATIANHDRLEDRLKQLHRRQINGGGSIDSSDSDDDDDDDLRMGLSIPGRANKRLAKSKRSRSSATASPAPAKRVHKDKFVLGRDSRTQPLAMTEGAWRTLSALITIWDRAWRGPATSTTIAEIDNDPPLLWQFPTSRQANSSRRTLNRASNVLTMADSVSRALDVAFSFPHVLPALAPPSNGTESASSFFGTKNTHSSRGDARPLLSVPESELLHRQEIGERKEEREVAARAETAADLLRSLHELVKLGCVQSVAFFTGISERIEPLRTAEIRYMMLPLIESRPVIVAKVLASYLEDAAEPCSSQAGAKASVSTRLHFDDNASIILNGKVAHAKPTEETASSRLRNSVSRDQGHDARAILDFLALYNLELDSSAASGLDLDFPTQSESRSQPIVRKRPQKQTKADTHLRKQGKSGSKGGDAVKAADTIVTPEMKKGGLQALAFVRAIEMEAKDRINQIKFLLAQALVALHSNALSEEQAGDVGSSPLTVPSDSQDSDVGLSENAGRKQDAKTRKSELRSFLSRLIKAFKRDSADFEACLSSMKTHLDGTAKPRRHIKAPIPVGWRGDGEGSAALPTLDSTADRCQKCLTATRNLIDATVILSEYLQ